MKGLSLTVIGHGAATDTFKRHLPLWLKIQPEHFLVLSPENDPITTAVPGMAHKWLGKAEHAGRDSVLRLNWLFEHLLELPGCSHHLICEYDSFSLSPEIPLRNGLTGIIMPNREPERFIAPRYPNPPWLIDDISLRRIRYNSRVFPAVWEEGYADRYLAAHASLVGVPILPYDPPGYTPRCGTISRAAEVNEMRGCILSGGTMIHGVKSAEVLEAATK